MLLKGYAFGFGLLLLLLLVLLELQIVSTLSVSWPLVPPLFAKGFIVIQTTFHLLREFHLQLESIIIRVPLNEQSSTGI